MLTLNQIVKSLNNFGSAHYQVNSFGVGDIQDFATSGTTQYPAMWVDIEPDGIKDGVFENTLRVYFCDIQLKDQTNFIEVYSDMQSVCLDLVAHLDSPTYFPQANTRIDTSNIVLTPFGEPNYDDEVLGYYMDITFRGNYLFDRCQIPFNSTIPTPTNPNSMNFSDNETPIGVINGINTIYTTAFTPIAISLYVEYQGQSLRWGVDYTVSANAITLTFAPETGTSLIVHYRY